MDEKPPLVQTIALAEKGYGKVFLEPFLGVILRDNQGRDHSWYRGSDISLKEFLKQNLRNVHTLFASMELPFEEIPFDRAPSTWSYVYASKDPHAPPAQKTQLNKRGVSVSFEPLPEAARLNEVWTVSQKEKRPFIAQSFGMSLDGKIATVTGDSKYISGPESLAFIHRLRHRYQAIMVGIHTVALDHPKLTTRLPEGNGHDPIRIVLDTHLSIDPEEPMLNQTSSAPTWIITGPDISESKSLTLKNKGVKIIKVALKRGFVDIEAALKVIYESGVRSILVEGGSTIHFSIIEAKLSDKVYAVVSPMIIGGAKAPTAVGGVGFAKLSEAVRLRWTRIEPLGEDLLLEAIKRRG